MTRLCSSHRCATREVLADQRRRCHNGFRRARHEADQRNGADLHPKTFDVHSRGDAYSTEGNSLCKGAVHLQDGVGFVLTVR